MDFNELVKKYHKDEATEEEIRYVEDTVLDARSVAKTRLKGEKKKGLGYQIRKVLVRILIVLILIGVLAVILWVNAGNNARNNLVIGRSEADRLAGNYISNQLTVDSSNLSIVSSKRRLIYTWPLARSYYLYEYQIKDETTNAVYLLNIDSYSGNIDYSRSK